MDSHRPNMSHLDTEYAKRIQEKAARRKVSGAIIARRKKRAYKILGVFAVFALIFSIQIIRTKSQARTVSTQVVAAKHDLQQQKTTTTKLNGRVKQLKNKDYVAKLVRAQYFYSKPGETIYSLPNDKAADVTQN